MGLAILFCFPFFGIVSLFFSWANCSTVRGPRESVLMELGFCSNKIRRQFTRSIDPLKDWFVLDCFKGILRLTGRVRISTDFKHVEVYKRSLRGNGVTTDARGIFSPNPSTPSIVASCRLCRKVPQVPNGVT